MNAKSCGSALKPAKSIACAVKGTPPKKSSYQLASALPLRVICICSVSVYIPSPNVATIYQEKVMTLKERYPLGNMKGLRALICEQSEKRRAQLRAEVKEMQLAKVGSPIETISVEEHRKAIRNHIQRSLIKQVKAGRYSFCMEFDAAPQDEVGKQTLGIGTRARNFHRSPSRPHLCLKLSRSSVVVPRKVSALRLVLSITS